MLDTDYGGCIPGMVRLILGLFGGEKPTPPPVNERPDFEVVQMYDAGDRAGLMRVLENDFQFTRGLDAAEALAKLGEEGGLVYLVNTLHHQSGFLRMAAADSLSRIRDARAERALRAYWARTTDVKENAPGVSPVIDWKEQPAAAIPVESVPRGAYGAWIIAGVVGALLGLLAYEVLSWNRVNVPGHDAGTILLICLPADFALGIVIALAVRASVRSSQGPEAVAPGMLDPGSLTLAGVASAAISLGFNYLVMGIFSP